MKPRAAAPFVLLLASLLPCSSRATEPAPPLTVPPSPAPSVAAAIAAAAPAHAVVPTHRHTHHDAATNRPHAPSAALGFANGGRLENAARLPADTAIRELPERPLDYGTDELVGLVRRVARRVYRTHHVRLSVGDLSALHGGPVGHHASHQNGRDADLGFYVTDAHNRPVALDAFADFGPDGEALDGSHHRFDTARNWSLVESLVTDAHVHVEHIFVADPLRALLLAYGRTHGASGSVLESAALALHQPHGASPHRNHFHVRISCPNGDLACRDGVRVPPRAHRRRHHGHGRETRTATR